jgi:hypothetical protein
MSPDEPVIRPTRGDRKDNTEAHGICSASPTHVPTWFEPTKVYRKDNTETRTWVAGPITQMTEDTRIHQVLVWEADGTRTVRRYTTTGNRPVVQATGATRGSG